MPEHAQLRVVGEDAGQVVAVGAQLEQLADGQPRAVAERLAVDARAGPAGPT